MRGLGILEILTIVFVVLKLTGIIAWSWWWVLSPFLGGTVLGLIVGIIVMANGISQGKSQNEIMENIINFWKKQQ